MKKKQLIVSDPAFIEIRQQLETWRSTNEKGKSIPDQIWDAAVKLAREYGISPASKELRLSYSDLKKRVYPSHSRQSKKKISKSPFIELDLNSTTSSQECIVEMEDNRGSKMKIHIKGQNGLDFIALGRAFLGK
jgi:hypothetical protein